MPRKLKPSTPFGERMIQARGKLSRHALAELLDCPPNTLGNWERGRTFPDRDVLVRIRDVLGISLDWLLTGEGTMRLAESTPVDGAEIDQNTLIHVIAGVEHHIERRQLRLKPDEKAVLMTLLYRWARGAAKDIVIGAQMIDDLIHLIRRPMG